MNKDKILAILETAVDKNGNIPMRLVRHAFEKLPELCEDAVSRRRLLSDLKKLIAAWKRYPVMAEQIKGVKVAIGYVEMIPSVTPKRKSGKWIEEQRGIKVTLYRCSECGRAVIDDTSYDAAKDFPFCHCGADMRQREEE